ncbi:MAG: GGDEF domain-containing protein [bacterium]|nr:GGDEF domain-containing protein [bacterium]
MKSRDISKENPNQWRLGSAIILIFLIGLFDCYTGPEIRINPLYYIPITLGAWRSRFRGAVLLAGLCALSWILSNYYAGLSFSRTFMWLVNISAQFVSFFLVGVLIVRMRAAHAQEKILSRSDNLTKLMNARAFYERLEYELVRAQRYEHPLTIGFLDLDNFKTVNDHLGHQAGDNVLCRVADLLKSFMRSSDTLARLGGDEFAVILPETDREQSRTVFAKILAALEKEMKERETPITASIGVVSYPENTLDSEGLISCADSAMYRAKEAGKNRVEFKGAPK